jgi:hypothetical protein
VHFANIFFRHLSNLGLTPGSLLSVYRFSETEKNVEGTYEHKL